MKTKSVISSILILTFLTVCVASAYEYYVELGPNEGDTDNIAGMSANEDCHSSIDARNATGMDVRLIIRVTPGPNFPVNHTLETAGTMAAWDDYNVDLSGEQVQSVFIDDGDDATGSAVYKLEWPL